jgi:hypothetical protein
MVDVTDRCGSDCYVSFSPHMAYKAFYRANAGFASYILFRARLQALFMGILCFVGVNVFIPGEPRPDQKLLVCTQFL